MSEGARVRHGRRRYDGRGKLDQKLRVSEVGETVVLPVGRADLSVALGRDHVVHAALCDRASPSSR